MPIDRDADGVSGAYAFTVRGPVEAGELGDTLTHEHLSVDWPSAVGAEPVPPPASETVDLIVGRLERAAEAGVRTFVDVGGTFGPSPELLEAVAVRTPVSIIASIGCLASDMGPMPAWAYPPADPESIARQLISEARTGIRDSGVQPGLIKVGTSARAISEVEENVIRGASLAQAETGLAITTHTTRTQLALEQVDLLESAGADLARVVIGHLGWGTGPHDHELHRRIADRGVFVGLDMVGLPAATVPEYAQMALDLIERGHTDQILLSHDNCAHSRGLIEVYGEEWLTGDFTVVHRQLLPMLAEHGVPPATITTIIRDNPRALLGIDARTHPHAGVAKRVQAVSRGD